MQITWKRLLKVTSIFCLAFIFAMSGLSCKEKSGSKEIRTYKQFTDAGGIPAHQSKPHEKKEHSSQPAKPETSKSLPTTKAVSQKKTKDTRETTVKVSLRVVFASKERNNIDQRVSDLAAAFKKEFKEYELTNFIQLDHKNYKMDPKSTLPVDLPGDRRLQITNIGQRDGKVVLGLEMSKMIKTTVLLSPNGKFSFGGPKYKFGKGMIIIVVKARIADE